MFANVVKVLMVIVAIASALGGVLEAWNPEVAAVVSAAVAAILAFVQKIQLAPSTSETEVNRIN